MSLELRDPEFFRGGETFQAATLLKLTGGKGSRTDFDGEKKGQSRGRKGIVENDATTTSGATTLIRTWARVRTERRKLRAILAGQVRIPFQFLTWMIANKMNPAAFSSMSEKDGVLLVVLQFEE